MAIIRSEWARVLLPLMLLGFLVFGNAIPNQFFYDDHEQIVENPMIESLTNIPGFFTMSTFSGAGADKARGVYYKPVMTTTFALIVALFGKKTEAFHVVQILVHVLNAFMVFLLLRRLFPELRSLWPSGLMAALFLVHPINQETATYASDYQDVLFFFFGMLAMLQVVGSHSMQIRNWIFHGVFLLLSLLSKETGALFVGLSTVYICLFRRNELRLGGLTLLPVVLGYAALRFGVAGLGVDHNNAAPINQLGFWKRMESLPAVWFYYLKTLVFPKDLAVGQMWWVREMGVKNFFLPLAAVSGVIYWLVRDFIRSGRSPRKSFFLIVLFSGMFLHSHFFPLDMTVADRWFYFPFVGVLGLIMERWRPRPWVVPVVAVLVVGFALRTVVRNENFRDPFTLYSHDVRVDPESPDLNNNLGVELFQRGRKDEAIAYMQKAAELAPHSWTLWNNLGVILEMRGDEARAEEYFRRSIELGGYYLAFENLAILLKRQGRTEELIHYLENYALKTLPRNPKLNQIYREVKGSGKESP